MKIIPITLRGKLFDDRKITAQIEDGLDKAAVELQVDFGKTVSTWKNKPTFVIEKRNRTRVVSAKNKIYFFISGGTRVRYATMTSDFKPKTAPGRFQAGVGAGGVLFISKKRPQPGIKARKFDKQLAARWKNKLASYLKLEIE